MPSPGSSSRVAGPLCGHVGRAAAPLGGEGVKTRETCPVDVSIDPGRVDQIAPPLLEASRRTAPRWRDRVVGHRGSRRRCCTGVRPPGTSAMAGTSVVGRPCAREGARRPVAGSASSAVEMCHQLCPSERPGSLQQQGVEDVEGGDAIGPGCGGGPRRVVVEAQVPAEPDDRRGRHYVRRCASRGKRRTHHCQRASPSRRRCGGVRYVVGR